MNLKDFTQSMVTVSPLMDGREKGDLDSIKGVETTITDYDFVNGDDGEYVVFTTHENPQLFYFGSTVLTQQMRKIEDAGYHEDVKKDGLPVKLYDRKSKNKRTYTDVTFYPESW